MKPMDMDASPRDGRDEMNLADFPISALQRAQKGDGRGGKLDRLEFRATRYDPASRQRVEQKVTLTSTAHDGLPTPADEHVILALLYVAKHTNNFEDATVHFAPSQLFAIMGWAPNGRSYARLRDVLRRLKSLTVRYENAWWDAAGRGYEEEVATGIVSGYRIARQASGPRTGQTEFASWVTWTQEFHASLQNGNLKRLDLQTFFALSTPTAQRMYRFLDKRFYNTDAVSMDLVEFACGHVGLAEVDNVAILKRRLAPAIEELESIGFIQKADAAGRYQKVKAGQWRVTFRSCKPSGPLVEQAALPAPKPEAGKAACSTTGPAVKEGPALDLAREFYRLWDATTPAAVGPRDLEQAAVLLAGGDVEEARALLRCLVQATRAQWPECRSLSGAVQKYLGDAIKLRQLEQRRAAGQELARRLVEQTRQEEANRQTTAQTLQARWDALGEAEREGVARRVRQRLGAGVPAAFLHRLCLEELGRMA